MNTIIVINFVCLECFAWRKQKKRLDAAIWPKQLLWLNKASYFRAKTWRKYQKWKIFINAIFVSPLIATSASVVIPLRWQFLLPLRLHLAASVAALIAHIIIYHRIIIIGWRRLPTDTFALFNNSKSKQNIIIYITQANAGDQILRRKFSSFKNNICRIWCGIFIGHGEWLYCIE